MRELDDWIEAGAVVRPHGLGGEVIADIKGDLADLVSTVEMLRATNAAGDEQSLGVEHSREHKGRLILKFSSCNTRDEAEKLRSWALWLKREQIGELEEGRWFVQDLIGLEVVTENGEHLGELVEVMPQPANDVFVVRSDGEELLLPVVDDVILDVDLSTGKVVVHLMEGIRRGIG